jgi:hypothetical protein
MKRNTLIALGCAIVFVGVAYAQQRSLLDMILTPQQKQSCGLHKLNAEEQKRLEVVFAALLSGSGLGDSAVEYLKSEGWDEVKVLGTKRLRLENGDDAEEYTIVEKGATTYILEPKTYASLSPGRYMGKMGYTSCEIIKRDGSTARFWTKDTR